MAQNDVTRGSGSDAVFLEGRVSATRPTEVSGAKRCAAFRWDRYHRLAASRHAPLMSETAKPNLISTSIAAHASRQLPEVVRHYAADRLQFIVPTWPEDKLLVIALAAERGLGGAPVLASRHPT